MPWVLAIMLFLLILAAAGGLAMTRAAAGLGEGIADRVTVQIVEADPAARERGTARALQLLAADPATRRAARVPDAEVAALVEAGLGEGALAAEVALPAMIDVDLAGGAAAVDELRARLRAAVPAARVDANGRWLAPVADLVRLLRLLAAGLMVLMLAASAAVVALAARAALNGHRGTIETLHLLGATDRQIVRLFQRRIALDAVFGGAVALAAAAAVLLLLGARLAELQSSLVSLAALRPSSWALLAALPAAGVLLATLVARATLLRALRRGP